MVPLTKVPLTKVAVDGVTSQLSLQNAVTGGTRRTLSPTLIAAARCSGVPNTTKHVCLDDRNLWSRSMGLPPESTWYPSGVPGAVVAKNTVLTTDRGVALLKKNHDDNLQRSVSHSLCPHM